MFKTGYVAAISLITLTLLLFNNCEGFSPLEDGPSFLGSTCEIPAQQSLKTSGFNQVEDCGVFEDILCEARVFSPDELDGVTQTRHCFESEVFGQACLDVEVRHFNTSNALGEPEDFLEGGTYNHSEFNCHNQRFMHKNRAILHSSAESIAQAVEQLHSLCQQGGHL